MMVPMGPPMPGESFAPPTMILPAGAPLVTDYAAAGPYPMPPAYVQPTGPNFF